MSLNDIGVKGCVVMVQSINDESSDVDEFLDLLQEVRMIVTSSSKRLILGSATRH